MGSFILETRKPSSTAIVPGLTDKNAQMPLQPTLFFDSCDECARSGNLDKIISDFQSVCDETTCRIAAENGHIDIHKYLYDNGCLSDQDAILAAAKNGRFECLKYLHEEGCEVVDSSIWCEDIVRNGNLGILKYCVENNITSLKAKDHHEEFCLMVAERGHLDYSILTR